MVLVIVIALLYRIEHENEHRRWLIQPSEVLLDTLSYAIISGRKFHVHPQGFGGGGNLVARNGLADVVLFSELGGDAELDEIPAGFENEAA
jgi:hypothetical protein